MRKMPYSRGENESCKLIGNIEQKSSPQRATKRKRKNQNEKVKRERKKPLFSF